MKPHKVFVKVKWKEPKIKHLKPTRWGWAVSYPEGLILGHNVDIGYGTYIQAQAGVIIENEVQIGAHCAIYSVNTINGTRGEVHLKKGCMIGAHSVILPGVVIEQDRLVKAGSVIY